jgi:hypothetical protein
MIPRACRQQAQFASEVAEAERTLIPFVVRIRHTLKDDWSGEPAVHFRIVLPDDACGHGRLYDVTSRISAEIVRRIEPLELWGVLPYFNYRSQSEQTQLKDPEWE